jgi:hypothetical protein
MSKQTEHAAKKSFFHERLKYSSPRKYLSGRCVREMNRLSAFFALGPADFFATVGFYRERPPTLPRRIN